MNKMIVISCAVLSSLEFPLRAEESAVELMAARSIPYSLRISELENDLSRRRVILQRLSRDLFRYWYQVELSGLARSSKIDSMARHVYAVSIEDFPNSKILKKTLNDPLNALSNWGDFDGKEKWKFSTEAEYQRSVEKFLQFLGGEKMNPPANQ